MQAWFASNPIVAYIVIFVLITYVYNKVFRVRQKLPLGKEIVLYVLMAMGTFMLLIFQSTSFPSFNVCWWRLV